MNKCLRIMGGTYDFDRAMFKFYCMWLMSNSWNEICNYIVYKKLTMRIILV